MKYTNFLAILLAFITVSATAQVTVILDFESPATSTDFFYFGGGVLDGTQNAIIANPDASGINTSATVMELAEGGDGATWAGMFPDPVPSVPIDLNGGGQICMDVWSPEVGEIALKLEESTSGVADWIFVLPVPVANEWVEVCFDPSIPSIEAPFAAAEGVYLKPVLFWNFGSTEQITTYVDNIVVSNVMDTSSYDVTFSIDMSDYAGSFSEVFVKGSFNGWSQDGNPLTDQGNGIWSATVPLPSGNYDYVYLVDSGDEEVISPWQECAKTSFGYTNRNIIVTSDTDIPMHCWNECYNCGEGINLTFNLNLDGIAPSPDGVYLAGGVHFGHGTFPLTDSGNGFHSITFKRLPGFEIGHFTFINGICYVYWDCKEDISGQDCADANNFNDRFYGDPINSEWVYTTCFGQCKFDEQCSLSTSVVDFLNNYVEITPTLTSDIVNINMNKFTPNVTASLVDLSGKVIESEILDTQNIQFNISNYPNGVYFINLTHGTTTVSQKVIKF